MRKECARKWRGKMAEKKMVEAITSMDVDFAQWYTDVVKKAELVVCDYGDWCKRRWKDDLRGKAGRKAEG